MNKTFSIAIDGPAGAGKSTIAKALAKALDAMYLDTGAMYRAFGLALLRMGVDVTDAIRSPEVSAAASAVSAVPEVRTEMVALQRRIAEGPSVIMDGRDIGTVVLPNATLKVYLTASAEVRADRRCRELAEKGTPQPYDQVLHEIKERDWRDSHREASPLRAAEDAVIVDTSDMSLDESVSALRALADKTCG